MAIELIARRVRADELEDVSALSLRCFPDHGAWSVAELTAELERPFAEVWIARRNGALLGFAVAWFAGDDGEVLTIATAPEARRSGIGRALLLRLLAAARVRAVRSLTLEVRPTNHAARELYESEGFRVIDVRAAYYVDGEDALIMARALP